MLVECARFGFFPGGHRGGETPVPIPNTAVKPSSADGTSGVTPWESRSLPGFFLYAGLSSGVTGSYLLTRRRVGSGAAGRSALWEVG